MGTRKFFRVVELFCNLIMMVVTHLYTITKIHLTIHFKWINLIVFKLQLNKVGNFLKGKILWYLLCQSANQYLLSRVTLGEISQVDNHIRNSTVTAQGIHNPHRLLPSWRLACRMFLSLNFSHLRWCLLQSLDQGCQTHFHRGPHQLHRCLQRAKCNFGTVYM